MTRTRGYLVEWGDTLTVTVDMLSRRRAMKLARKMSAAPSIMVAYVLNAGRTGQMVYCNGRFDHRNGDRI